MATRDAGGQVINALAAVVTNLVGGSADLDPSTRTAMKGCGDFESPHVAVGRHRVADTGRGRRRLGIRGTKHSFRAARARDGRGLDRDGASWRAAPLWRDVPVVLRLHAAQHPAGGVEQAHVIYIWTHDSIALGEDGPTHQPVEQLASLRAMPNMMVVRPSDATETVEAWRVALTHTEGPVGLVLTRQKLPVLDRPQTLRPGIGTRAGRVRPGGGRRIGARA